MWASKSQLRNLTCVLLFQLVANDNECLSTSQNWTAIVVATIVPIILFLHLRHLSVRWHNKPFRCGSNDMRQQLEVRRIQTHANPLKTPSHPAGWVVYIPPTYPRGAVCSSAKWRTSYDKRHLAISPVINISCTSPQPTCWRTPYLQGFPCFLHRYSICLYMSGNIRRHYFDRYGQQCPIVHNNNLRCLDDVIRVYAVRQHYNCVLVYYNPGYYTSGESCVWKITNSVIDLASTFEKSYYATTSYKTFFYHHTKVFQTTTINDVITILEYTSPQHQYYSTFHPRIGNRWSVY